MRSTLRRRRLNRRAIERFCGTVMKKAGFPEDSELSVLIVGRRGMRSLNRRYRGVDRETDVLAFPQGRFPGGEGPRPVGDVVVSLDAAMRRSGGRGSALNREVLLYLVHGVLHLAGYDDASPRGRKEMEARQERILEAALREGRWIVTG